MTTRRFLPCAGAVLATAALLGPVSTAGAADAVLFADGFETGSTSAWTVTGTVVDQQEYVRTGAWAALASGTGSPAYLRKKLTTGSPALQVTTAVDVVSQGTTPVTLLTIRRGTGA